VVTLGRRYGIVTPYTSFLVTEDVAVAQPVVGWRNQGVDDFGADEERWDGPMGGGGFGDGQTWGGPRPETTAMPASPAPAEVAQYQALSALSRSAGSTSADAASGESGRRMSEQLRDMREADHQQTGALTRYVAGRLFVQSGGVWTEDGADGASETLQIRYMSAAYFALLTARPELRELLSLGENVTFRAAEGKAIVIRADAGRESVPAADLEAFLAD